MCCNNHFFKILNSSSSLFSFLTKLSIFIKNSAIFSCYCNDVNFIIKNFKKSPINVSISTIIAFLYKITFKIICTETVFL